jgi:2-oxoglutarate ferredoxin oxidoreductase subunit beta
MSEEKTNRFLPYMREERLPHIFCPGCGNGAIMNAFLEAMEKAELDFDNIAMVSGIGCSSRIPGYMKCDSLHTTHGRALTFATGLKIANKDLDVVVFTGDGDGASIGGNHLIHAARRNLNLTVICINNNIYGMTGGQISPTSPKGTIATTAPYGNYDNPFKLAELVAAAGASYSARWTSVDIENLVLSIKKGLKHPGFSFIEVATLCPTYYGRKNKLKTPTAMAAVMKANTVYKSAADRMKEKDLEGKIVLGEFADAERDEFGDMLEKFSIDNSGKKTVVNSAYETEF